MKLFLLSTVNCATLMGSADIKRTITGDWINQFYGRTRRADVQGELGFRPMAAMKMYMSNAGNNNADPSDLAEFENMLDEMEQKYTNYGCYCWINGVDSGVLGGGKTKDMTDHHCKELYRCYKCVQADYAKNYTDVSYTVDFAMENGERSLDCSANSKQDAENICECDKRFAENIAKAEQSCDAGSPADPEWGEHCMEETFRTKNGGGSFDPSDAAKCNKQFHGHNNENCCGFYPNRYPYDINQADCCRVSQGNVEIFSIQPLGVCEGAGGDIVMSEKGDPHSYINLSN